MVALVVAVVGLVQVSASQQAAAQAQGEAAMLRGVIERAYGVDMSLLTAAMKEGKLSWYTSTGLEESQNLLAEFEKRFPFIRTEATKLTGGPLEERIRTEQARGDVGGDVVDFPGAGGWLPLDKAGAFEPFEPEGLEIWPTELQPFKPDGYAARVGEVAVGYNTKLVKPEEAKALASWDGMVDPKWKGKFAIADPNLVGSISEAGYLVWKAKGDDWIAKLAALNPVLYNSNVPATDAITKGEQAVALVSSHFVANAYAKGAPVGIAYPEPDTAFLGIVSVLKGAKHPNAAKLFITWLMSAEGQSMWSMALGSPPLLPSGPDRRAIAAAPGYKRPPKYIYVDPPVYEKERPAFMAVWNKYFKK